MLHQGQPFKNSINYIIDNIHEFNFSKHDIAILAYYQMYQILENMEIK